MFIGRIITNSKKLEALDFIEVTEKLEDSSIPTLIIGKDNAESLYSKDLVKVLNKEIKPNVYWTFRKTERRVDYETDLKKFYDRIISIINSNIKYEYFNIFIEPSEKSAKFVEWLYKGGKKYIYQVNEHLYIYSSGRVIGFSLVDAEYLGKDKENILKKIHDNKNNVFVNSLDFISENFLKLIKNNNIIIPYLYFLHEN